MNALNILVLDDNAAHRASAEHQLAGHNLTVVSSYNEASELLESNIKFDMALLDLMMPAADMRTLGENAKEFHGKELPMGTILAFQALKAGVKKVAVLTDTNHHNHPASAAFDYLGGSWNNPSPIRVGDARMFFTNYLHRSFAADLKEKTSARFEGEEKPWLAVCYILCSDTE